MTVSPVYAQQGKRMDRCEKISPKKHRKKIDCFRNLAMDLRDKLNEVKRAAADRTIGDAQLTKRQWQIAQGRATDAIVERFGRKDVGSNCLSNITGAALRKRKEQREEWDMTHGNTQQRKQRDTSLRQR
jgi:hypothetical protein